MSEVNLGLRFLFELGGIAALATWGWQVTDALPGRILAAGVAVGALVVIWALVVAPKASNPIPLDLRMLIGTGLLLLSAGALALAGHPQLALVYAVLVAVNQVLLLLLGGHEA